MTSSPNRGTTSVEVARQYCGALGKRANCQVAMSVHAATDYAPCPPRQLLDLQPARHHLHGRLVRWAKMRWRIEHDYRELQREAQLLGKAVPALGHELDGGATDTTATEIEPGS